jgi:hypothetical protein
MKYKRKLAVRITGFMGFVDRAEFKITGKYRPVIEVSSF